MVDLCSSSDHNAKSCPYYTCHAKPNFAPHTDSSDVVLTLSDSSLPLAQCTGFEGGEPFRYVARLSGDSVCSESEDTFDMAHHLASTPLEGCHDMFVYEGSPSFGTNYIVPYSLERFHVSTFCSQPSFSPKLDFLMYPLIIWRFVILS